MKDPQRTARALRAIAALIENPQAQAELAEQAIEAARARMVRGLQEAIDKFKNPNP